MTDVTGEKPRISRGLLAALVVYALFQIVMPLRHRLYGGNVLWHEQGMRFSWRVMVREKNVSVTYYVEDKATGRVRYVRPRDYLDARQEKDFGGQPDLILQLAHHIRDEERKKGFDVRVRAEAYASLNGRPQELLVDPTVDLSGVRDGIGRASFLRPEPMTPPAHLASPGSSPPRSFD